MAKTADGAQTPGTPFPAGGVPGKAARQRPAEFELFNRAWKFLSAMRLALVLILLLVVVVLAGTLIDQAPPTVIADQLAYDQWLERARGRYGGWTGTMDRLQLFNIFHTLWFRAIIALLTLNIVVCTMNRWHGIYTTVFHTRARMGEPFFQHARFNATVATPMPLEEAADRVRRALSRSRYHLKTDVADGSVAFFADKNRLSRFGTFFTHLSIVLLLAGTVIGGMFGFKDPEFVVAEGSTRPLGLGTGISVRLDHFADEYYIDGGPKDYRSDVVLYENGKEVTKGTVQVNSPLRYKGIVFHQAFYGQTAVMKVEDKAGKVLFNDGVPHARQTTDGGRPVGSFKLPEQNLSVYVVGPRSGETDPLIPAGQTRVEVYRQESRASAPLNLSQGTPAELVGFTFTFQREGRFTGLKVVKDPGTNIIWVASTLMVLGMVMLFYLPKRRLWALCKTQPDGTTTVMLGMPAQRDTALAGDFEHVRSKVARSLGADDTSNPLPEGDDDV
jgi:cytochrome c biogenesis protein